MLKERLAQDASAVDKALKELFRPEAAVPAHLQEVMAYSVTAETGCVRRWCWNPAAPSAASRRRQCPLPAQ